jgi:hypothetical protein
MAPLGALEGLAGTVVVLVDQGVTDAGAEALDPLLASSLVLLHPRVTGLRAVRVAHASP